MSGANGGYLSHPKHYYHTVNLGHCQQLQPSQQQTFQPIQYNLRDSSPNSAMPSNGNHLQNGSSRVKVPPSGSQHHQTPSRILSPVPRQPAIYAQSTASSMLPQPSSMNGSSKMAYNSHSLDRNSHLRVFQTNSKNSQQAAAMMGGGRHGGGGYLNSLMAAGQQVQQSAIPSSPFRFSLASQQQRESANLSSFLVSPRHQMYSGKGSQGEWVGGGIFKKYFRACLAQNPALPPPTACYSLANSA